MVTIYQELQWAKKKMGKLQVRMNSSYTNTEFCHNQIIIPKKKHVVSEVCFPSFRYGYIVYIYIV